MTAGRSGELSDDAFLKQTVFFKERSFTPAEFHPGGTCAVEVAAGRSEECDRRTRVASTAALKMAMLNNESGPLNDYRIETFGLAQFFDGFFCSAYIGDAQAGAADVSRRSGDAALQTG